jgi:hypothetical protein
MRYSSHELVALRYAYFATSGPTRLQPAQRLKPVAEWQVFPRLWVWILVTSWIRNGCNSCCIHCTLEQPSAHGLASPLEDILLLVLRLEKPSVMGHRFSQHVLIQATHFSDSYSSFEKHGLLLYRKRPY